MSGRKQIIAGNFKLNKTLQETKEYFKSLGEFKTGSDSHHEVLIFPTPLTVGGLESELRNQKQISLGLQNIAAEPKGAFTGELSSVVAKELGVKWILLGHSERRHVFHENFDLIEKKLKLSLESGFHTMLCVGETLSENEQSKTQDVLSSQLACLKNISFDPSRFAIAYEPVWAIGTGRTATSEVANQCNEFCRKEITKLCGSKVAEELPILYGGSVTVANAKELLAQTHIDGVLVGGASLLAQDFAKIVASRKNFG